MKTWPKLVAYPHLTDEGRDEAFDERLIELKDRVRQDLVAAFDLQALWDAPGDNAEDIASKVQQFVQDPPYDNFGNEDEWSQVSLALRIGVLVGQSTDLEDLVRRVALMIVKSTMNS
ncbi:hypothetical protein KBC70_04180 [Candidatus Woesebacteria bacterium]|nr:hypothetical protein [Candidatus Woesebacteria bacterium]